MKILLLLAVATVVVLADEGYKQQPKEGAYNGPSFDGKKPDGYFQYANIPGEHEYEFGYNRGNPSHFTSRFEQAKDWRFRTKVKWGDDYGNQGEQYWEYNHGHQHEPEYKEDYKAPAKEYAPAPYSAPAYKQPPKYEAPKYEAPKYEAPKYEAPKYEYPKYEQKYEAPKY